MLGWEPDAIEKWIAVVRKLMPLFADGVMRLGMAQERMKAAGFRKPLVLTLYSFLP